MWAWSASATWGGSRVPPLLATVRRVHLGGRCSSRLVFLVLQAVQVGWAELRQILLREPDRQLVWNTVSLLVVVTVLCALVGTLAAWFVERTDLPFRRVFAVGSW